MSTVELSEPHEPADGLAAVVALRRLADLLEAAQVERALREGWSWSEIAEALGVTRQAVHKKYAKRVAAAGIEMRRRDKITDVLRKSKPGGASAFYDAILMACTNRTLVHGEPYEPRRVLIVIGDGHDTASKKISFDQVVELAKRNLVTIYAISTQSYGFSNSAEDDLERLTRETGGHVEYPLNKDLYKDVSGYISVPKDAGNYVYEAGTGGYAAEIAGAITRAIVGISGDITSQYILRFVPEASPDAKFKAYHHIKVEIPAVPGVVIRTRDGYYPVSVPSQPTGAQ